MATLRQRLGAPDRGTGTLTEFEQPLGGFNEFFGFHVDGVPGEGVHLPGSVWGVILPRTPATQARKPDVFDSHCLQRSVERCPGEMWMSLRRGIATNISENANPVGLQDGEELIQGVRRVTERQNLHDLSAAAQKPGSSGLLAKGQAEHVPRSRRVSGRLLSRRVAPTWETRW